MGLWASENDATTTGTADNDSLYWNNTTEVYDNKTPIEARAILNVEDGADVTDTANVTAAGALMDSEVTNLAQVKAFDSSDYATAAQGSTADSALQNIVEDTTPQLGGDLDGQGNYLTDVQNIPDILAKGPGYWFDGVDDYIDCNTDLNLSSEFSFIVTVRPDSILGSQTIVSQWGTNDAFALYADNSFSMNTNGLSTNANPTTEPAVGVIATVIWTYSESAGVLVSYYNGRQENIVTGVTGALATGADELWIGRLQSTLDRYFSGDIFLFRAFNLALDPTDPTDKAIINGGDVPWKYLGASQTELTSGTLTIGKKYRLKDWITADDFTNVGAASNADGVEFVATGTTPTTWTNSSKVVQIGQVAAYEPSGITDTQWLDSSGNGNDGTVNGALAFNKPHAGGLNNTIQNDIFALDVRDFAHYANSNGTGDIINSTMAFVPRFITSGWPQAALNGLEVGGFWIDVFENSQPDASSISRGGTSANSPGLVAGCSKSGVVPWTDIDWLNARIAASNRVINGRNCHLVTPSERFAVLSLIMANGIWSQQRGNNNNGKDTRDTDTWDKYGITDPIQAEYRKLTGTGPSSWCHNGLPGRGIHNLVGNIYEWEDCWIESGLIQPKAYLAGATAASATYIDYDDNGGGDGVDICQLTPGVYTITDATYGNEDVTIERVIITGRFAGRAILASATSLQHIDNALMQLKTALDISNGASAGWIAIGALLEDATGKYMALPDQSDTTTHASTYLDSWYKYDNSDSRALQRCGFWGVTTKARSGLVVATSYTPTDVGMAVGFRAALSIGSL